MLGTQNEGDCVIHRIKGYIPIFFDPIPKKAEECRNIISFEVGMKFEATIDGNQSLLKLLTKSIA